MAWRHAAGGCLALLLLAQGAALANSITQMPGASETADSLNQPAEAAPPPWAELRSRDLERPLLGGEYNRIMDALWTQLDDQWTVESYRIDTACDALGSDMAYLRGRVPRQIEDAYRQMAPFQTKALSKTLPAPAQRQSTVLGLIMPLEYTKAEALLELIRAGDPHTYATYEQLLRHFVDLDLAAYLDPAQDDVPLSRGEFLAYVETLHREFQDPMGVLRQHNQFLLEADRLIQDLLTMLREVRRSLALLEATKAIAGMAPELGSKAAVALPTTAKTVAQELFEGAIAPRLPAQYIAWITTPGIAIESSAPVTRRDFLLAIMGLLAFVESTPHSTPQCGGYRMENFVSPAEAVHGEVWYMMQALDSLNLEILNLVRDRGR